MSGSSGLEGESEGENSSPLPSNENQQEGSSSSLFVSPGRDFNSNSPCDEPDDEDQSPNYEPPDDEDQSPNYEPPDDDDEEEDEEEDPNYRPSPEAPPPSPKPSSSSNYTVIPSNGFAPAYDCPLLSKLGAAQSLPHPLAVHFAHLNCFHLTHPNTRAATTVIELKQHVQAVCLLLTLLQPSTSTKSWPYVAADPPFPVQFDFLSDLTEPYPGARPDGGAIQPWHDRPLPGLSNTLESGHGGIDNIEQCTRPELLANANKLLTRLDHVYRFTGGILSIPPPAPPPPESDATARTNEPAGFAQNSILAQWLGFTRALTLRLASLEKEMAALREVLGHEAFVASVRGKQSREKTANGEGCGEREIVFPQDRYVLAGLSEGLWARLNEELTVREDENREEVEHEREEREQGRGVQGRGWGDFGAGADEDEDEEAEGGGGESNVVTWIETMSRLYRIRGHDNIFVIPAFGLHPGAPAVHRVERTPLVQAVAERRVVEGDWAHAGATAWERDMAARARDRDAHILELEAAVVQLKRELETEKTARRRLVAEAELKGRRAGGGMLGAAG